MKGKKKKKKHGLNALGGLRGRVIHYTPKDGKEILREINARPVG